MHTARDLVGAAGRQAGGGAEVGCPAKAQTITAAGRPTQDVESADAAASPQELSAFTESRGERERADVALAAAQDAAPRYGMSG